MTPPDGVQSGAASVWGLNSRRDVTPDRQISLTDPDARSMATRSRGAGMVGYNVQAAVDTQHQLIVTPAVVNEGHDRSQLSPCSVSSSAATSMPK